MSFANTDERPAPIHDRLLALDGLRGVAILMVVFWHYYSCVPRAPWTVDLPLIRELAVYGWAGVPLFFAISGFLIGRILIAHRGQPGYYRVFYLRRAARLLPLYFVLLGLFLVVRAALPLVEHPALERLLGTEPPYWAYPLFLQNFGMAEAGNLGGNWLGVTWSLAVEEQFYLVLPVIVAIVSPRLLPGLLCVAVFCGILFRFVVLKHDLAHPAALMVLLPGRIDGFALGILAAIKFERRPDNHYARLGTVLGILTCALAVHFGTRVAYSEEGLVIYRTLTYTLIGISFALILRHVRISPQGRFSQCLSIRPLVWIGSVSYFVYLFHEPANHLLHYAVHRQAPNIATSSGVALTMGALAAVFMAASLSRRYVEEPMIRLAKRNDYGPRQLAALDSFSQGTLTR